MIKKIGKCLVLLALCTSFLTACGDPGAQTVYEVSPTPPPESSPASSPPPPPESAPSQGVELSPAADLTTVSLRPWAVDSLAAIRARDDVALYVRSDGLYAADLLTGEEICLDASSLVATGIPRVTQFSFSLELSADHKLAAYTKGAALFLVPVDFDGPPCEPRLLCEEVGQAGYVFAAGAFLYAPASGGLYTYDLSDGHGDLFLDGSCAYTELVAAPEKLYAVRRGDDAEGVVEIDLSDRSASMIVLNELVEPGVGTLHPPIGVSADGRYFYLIGRTRSGSISTDGVSVAVYDSHAQTYTPLDFPSLQRSENFSIHPTDGTLAFMHGVGREMTNENKTLRLWDPAAKKMTSVSDEDSGGAMNPCFSHDGQKLVYSAGKSFADYDYVAASVALERNGEYYEQHGIWEYSLTTGRNTRITDTGFAMWPRYIDQDRALCYVRLNGDAYDLYVYEDGVERLAVAGIPDYDYSDNHGFFNLTPILRISSSWNG
ncbi:MAG: hypothetical protein LBK75_10705 [Oscillospiraceae bacterium]|jgi:hypothetical protein|nr:hypothetical protein [Oscillospiraceae bacterium]